MVIVERRQQTTPITPEQERAIEKKFYDSQPLRSECTICGEWSFEGEAGEARERAIEHRRERHPETFKKRRSKRTTRSLNSFRTPNMTKEDLKEIDDARRRRAFLIGIEIEE